MRWPATDRCFGLHSPTAAFGDLIQISHQSLRAFRPVDPLTGPNPAESAPNQPVSAIRPVT